MTEQQKFDLTEEARLHHLYQTRPIIRLLVSRQAKTLADWARSEEGRQAIDEWITSCYVMDLGEPEEEVFS